MNVKTIKKTQHVFIAWIERSYANIGILQSENEMCHDFPKIFDNLKRSYFFCPREDMNCQPISWKFFFLNRVIIF